MKTFVADGAASIPSTEDSQPWLSDKQRGISRLRGRRRSRPHVVLGLLLPGLCAGAFLWISLATDDQRPVLALAHEVAVGHVVTEQDLRRANVAVDAGVLVEERGLRVDQAGDHHAGNAAERGRDAVDALGGDEGVADDEDGQRRRREDHAVPTLGRCRTPYRRVEPDSSAMSSAQPARRP